ncbi:GroES-like protein [Suhomyces tanzawaensis NRRL Y-17324]|uniref:GroES-like protein n=1 Tax=Suhomyces tanzawaensis NRRL Y-17324 TaxID=984487 RepID=A0A1E4SE19_9ASCO|nr:GroES-like protein [Suhomyces tanzawaensis NRRL Y-17324]ODV77733.1 GroES-like protein [Suhomyces tanzawaensis NRRL Y-17324]
MSKQVKAVTIKRGSKVPEYKQVELRAPEADEVVVKVIAAGFSHLVRGRALGTHYSLVVSAEEKAVGVDGVGYVEDELVFFTTFFPEGGSYGQYIVTKKNQVYPLPKDADETSIARVAALANGLMSSVLPLGGRVPNLKEGATIVILGVTGTAGQLAIQAAKLGYKAAKVIGIARSTKKLQELQASQPLLDEIIGLDSDDSDIVKLDALGEVDVVLDYLWGPPATRILNIALTTKKVPSDALHWVQIGQISGDAQIPVTAAFLRGNNFQILGSGLGPLKQDEQSRLLAKTVELLSKGTVTAPFASAKLSNIAQEWDSEWDSQIRKYFVVEH